MSLKGSPRETPHERKRSGTAEFLIRDVARAFFPRSTVNYLQVINRYGRRLRLRTIVFSIRWLVVRHSEIQRRVDDEVREADLHLQCHLVPAKSKFRRPRYRLGISKRRRRQEELRASVER